MARNTSLSLGEPFTEFIDSAVQSGEYASASEVVRDALRMKMQVEQKREALRQAIREGFDSGPPLSIDPVRKLAELKKRPRRTRPFDPRVVGPEPSA